jgi:uncharacterized membrane protein
MDSDWHNAVRHINTVMEMAHTLYAGLPFLAGFWIAVRRRRKPKASTTFGWLVLCGWVGAIVTAFLIFFSGTWYSENGPHPRENVWMADVTLYVLVIIYVALIATLVRWKELLTVPDKAD